MPIVFIKGKGATAFQKHLAKEHPKVHVVVLKSKSKRRK